MKYAFWKWSRVSAIAGIVVAVAFFMIEKLFRTGPDLQGQLDYPVFRLMQIFWPTSIFLLATDGSENTLGSYLIVAIAVVANGIVYFFVGAIMWFMRQLMMKRKE